MGLFNKEKLGKAFSDAKNTINKTITETSDSIKKSSEASKELKAPAEGAIQRYGVIYIGGLPEFSKKKSGEIGFNIMPDKFILKATSTSKEWFADMVIPYDKIQGFEIVKRTVSNTEMLLSTSGSDMKSLEQENNIEITFVNTDEKKLVLRLEMLTGVSVYGQAGKCRELIDVLRQNDIYDQLIKKDNAQSSNNDVLSQIEKLSSLLEKGILSQEEYQSKKAELLNKL